MSKRSSSDVLPKDGGIFYERKAVDAFLSRQLSQSSSGKAPVVTGLLGANKPPKVYDTFIEWRRLHNGNHKIKMSVHFF